MGELGMLIPVLVACIGLYALYWARTEEGVQPEKAVAGGETAATGNEATEIDSATGTEGGTIPLFSEGTPEGVS